MRDKAVAFIFLLSGIAASAQTTDSGEDVFCLQLQRFQGSYCFGKKKSPDGAMTVKAVEHGSDILCSAIVDGKPIQLHVVSLYDKADHKGKASLEYEGATWVGSASVDDSDLLIETRKDRKIRSVRLHLEGRSTAVIRLTQKEEGSSESALFELTGTRK